MMMDRFRCAPFALVLVLGLAGVAGESQAITPPAHCLVTPGGLDDADGDGVRDGCACGDANHDGFVDSNDAYLVGCCVTGEVTDVHTCSGLCDTNNDGVCNTLDRRLIERVDDGELTQLDLGCAARCVPGDLCKDDTGALGVCDLAGGCVPTGDVSNVIAGARLYDSYFGETGLAAPTTDHPLWATRPDMSSNPRTGKDTWRCKECHGWDYKGVTAPTAEAATAPASRASTAAHCRPRTSTTGSPIPPITLT